MTTSVQQAAEVSAYRSSPSERAIVRPCCSFCGDQGNPLYSGMIDWLFGVPGEWAMRACPRCDVIWLDPQPCKEDIPGLYQRYITHGAPPERTWFGRMQADVSRCVLSRAGYPVDPATGLLPHLLAHLPAAKRDAILSVSTLPPAAGATLLDVGCGNGDFITRMRDMGWKVFGVDPDPAAVAFGRSQGLNIFTGMIEDVPLTPSYDAIVLNHVIEHVDDPVALLRECRTRLKPDTGRLVIATPNLNSFGHRSFKKFWRGLEVPRHFTVFSVREIGRASCRERV